MSDQQQADSYLYLEKRNQVQSRMRFYALHVTQTLFGDWALVCEWGCIGSPGVVRSWAYPTRDEARVAFARKQSEKIREGYLPLYNPG